MIINNSHSSACEIKKQAPSLILYAKSIGTGYFIIRISNVTGRLEYNTECLLIYGTGTSYCNVPAFSQLAFYSDYKQDITINCAYKPNQDSANPIVMWVLLTIAIIVIIAWLTIAILKCYKFKKNKPVYPSFTRIIKNDKFPVTTFAELRQGEDEECTICKQRFLQDSEVRTLECKHFYHKNCIDEWFQNHQFCCVCKKEYCGQDFFSQRILNNSLNASLPETVSLQRK